VTVLEAFRLVVESKWRGSRPIHFMWFAAEEPGLLGSATVAALYKKEKRDVYGMLQFDMTGEKFRGKFP
jgi:bacterial leucyl aminopeptidase